MNEPIDAAKLAERVSIIRYVIRRQIAELDDADALTRIAARIGITEQQFRQRMNEYDAQRRAGDALAARRGRRTLDRGGRGRVRAAWDDAGGGGRRGRWGNRA